MPDKNKSSLLAEKILKLKKDMNATILAHYYQEEEIQKIADYIGDSLDLSRKAAQSQADVIVFCGVKFMAEVAKILNPTKTVLLPDLEAGCSLEDSCPADKLKEFCDKHPKHKVVSYINCSAEVKALSDVIVTSSNAVNIVNSIDDPIIFTPDKYLGKYIIKQTKKPMILWDGSCVVHENFSEKAVVTLKVQHPEAYVIAHPECPEHLLNYADHIGSTSSLLNFTKNHPNSSFIVLTEPGIFFKMKQESPNSIFIPVSNINATSACNHCNNCHYMKMNTLEKLYNCMLNNTPSIQLSEQTMHNARKPLEKMLTLSV